MSKIKRILDSLPKEEQKKLNDAFEKQEPYWYLFHRFPIEIDAPRSRYIGVNVEKIPGLIEEEKHGEWSLGRLKDANN